MTITAFSFQLLQRSKTSPVFSLSLSIKKGKSKKQFKIKSFLIKLVTQDLWKNSADRLPRSLFSSQAETKLIVTTQQGSLTKDGKQAQVNEA